MPQIAPAIAAGRLLRDPTADPQPLDGGAHLSRRVCEAFREHGLVEANSHAVSQAPEHLKLGFIEREALAPMAERAGGPAAIGGRKTGPANFAGAIEI
jgi:hypothetical protein